MKMIWNYSKINKKWRNKFNFKIKNYNRNWKEEKLDLFFPNLSVLQHMIQEQWILFLQMEPISQPKINKILCKVNKNVEKKLRKMGISNLSLLWNLYKLISLPLFERTKVTMMSNKNLVRKYCKWDKKQSQIKKRLKVKETK